MSYAKSGTLTISTVASVTVTADGGGVQVVNRSQTGVIWVRLDGTDPVAAADDCFSVLGVRHFPTHTGAVTVKMISANALDYSVEGLAVVS